MKTKFSIAIPFATLPSLYRFQCMNCDLVKRLAVVTLLASITTTASADAFKGREFARCAGVFMFSSIVARELNDHQVATDSKHAATLLLVESQKFISEAESMRHVEDKMQSLTARTKGGMSVLSKTIRSEMAFCNGYTANHLRYKSQ